MRHLVMMRAIAGAVAIGACGGTTEQSASGDTTHPAAAAADLHGAGSTFAFPLYSAWTQAFAKRTGITITYESIGSGDGIRRFSDETIDFGGTDGPMSDAELSHAKGGVVLH